MEHQQAEISDKEEWRKKFNAAEVLAGQLRDRLRALTKSVDDEAEKSGDGERAGWWQAARERLNNGISEADQISDTLASLDEDLPEFNQP